ncbi:TonB protein, partial [gut metagenome]
MKRLYHRDGNWYKPSSSTSTTGDLDKILKNVQGKSRLKSGLKENGIDPNNLGETLKHF